MSAAISANPDVGPESTRARATAERAGEAGGARVASTAPERFLALPLAQQEMVAAADPDRAARAKPAHAAVDDRSGPVYLHAVLSCPARGSPFSAWAAPLATIFGPRCRLLLPDPGLGPNDLEPHGVSAPDVPG